MIQKIVLAGLIGIMGLSCEAMFGPLTRRISPLSMGSRASLLGSCRTFGGVRHYATLSQPELLKEETPKLGARQRLNVFLDGYAGGSLGAVAAYPILSSHPLTSTIVIAGLCGLWARDRYNLEKKLNIQAIAIHTLSADNRMKQDLLVAQRNQFIALQRHIDNHKRG